jgi:hypothetical protein
MPIEPITAAAPTPETTPVPGGGSWRWDIALPGWVPNPDPDAPVEPTETPQE